MGMTGEGQRQKSKMDRCSQFIGCQDSWHACWCLSGSMVTVASSNWSTEYMMAVSGETFPTGMVPWNCRHARLHAAALKPSVPWGMMADWCVVDMARQ